MKRKESTKTTVESIRTVRFLRVRDSNQRKMKERETDFCGVTRTERVRNEYILGRNVNILDAIGVDI